MSNYKSLGYVAAIFGGLSFGSIPILSAILRDDDVSSIEQSIVRLFFGICIGIIFIIFFLFKNKDNLQQSLKFSAQKTYFVQGSFLSLMIVLYLSSISMGTPAGEAAFLVQIHPVITLFLGWFFLKERITKIKLFSIFFALLGLVLLTEPWNWDSFLQFIMGDLLVIFLGILYAGYLLINRWGTKFTKEVFSPISISWVLIWAFIIGIPLFFLFSLLPLPSYIVSISLNQILAPKTLVYGCLLALFGSLVPYGLIMVTSKYVESSIASILLLTEPIGAIILGAIVLGEPITVPYVFGGLSILIAASIIFAFSRRKDDPERSKTKETIELKIS